MKGKQNQQFPMRPHITCNHLINAYTDQGWLSLVLTLKSTNSLWTSVGCKSMHTYLKIRNKRIGVHTNWCWSLTDSPAIPSFGVSLGWTSFAKALNDDGGHLTASYPCKKTSDYKLCFTQLESNLQSTRIIVIRKHLFSNSIC